MDQLITTFGLDWRLLLIQAVNFGVLLAALTYLLYRPVLRLIDERREKIAEGVRTAEAAQQRLAAAQAEGEVLIGDAAREAEGLVASARTRAEGASAEIVKQAEERAQGILRDADARAEEAKRLALKETEREIARTAMLAAEKILRAKKA